MDILIKPFYGEDQNDQALIDLIPILINIAKDNIDTRNGLVKYRDEIMTKITSNLFRRNNDKMYFIQIFVYYVSQVIQP